MFAWNGSTFTLVAVVAMAENGIIGREGAMPWHLPSDLRRYRVVTMGRPMIMGRKTLQSIGRVLDGRDSIVLTRSPHTPMEGAIAAGTPDAALEAAARCAQARQTNEIVIVGGGEIYDLFLPLLDRIEMTVVQARPEGDTHFPQLDANHWHTTAEAPMARTERDSATAVYRTLERRGAAQDGAAGA